MRRRKSIAGIGTIHLNVIALWQAHGNPPTSWLCHMYVTDHLMLPCPKCIFPIPSTTSSPDSVREWQTFHVALADFVKAVTQYNFFETAAFNLKHYNHYFQDYCNVIVTNFLQLLNQLLLRSNFALYAPQSFFCMSESCATSWLHHTSTQTPTNFWPFQKNPFSVDCVISLLQSIPKGDSSVPGVAHDLSFPAGQSVDDGITRDKYLTQPFKLRLPGTDRLVEFINRKVKHH